MLLSRPLPLRTTSVWTGYHETRSIPIAVGRCTLSPIPYDQTRRIWVVSDQPIVSVGKVTFGADPVRAWTYRNTTDSTGHASAQIEFSEPVPDNIAPSVDVIGMPHPLAQGLMENPADLVWWILTTLAGRSIDYRDFYDARVLCSNAGLLVGGVLEDGAQTIRATITDILDSVGATWALGVPGVVRLYPQPVGIQITTISDISEFSAVTGMDALANRIILNFHRDWAVGDTLAAVTVDAPESQNEYGLITLAIDAPWLHDQAAAIALAQRLLDYRSRPVWKYTWRTGNPITPGVWVTVNHNYAPVSTAYILGCDYDLARNEAEIQAEAYA